VTDKETGLGILRCRTRENHRVPSFRWQIAVENQWKPTCTGPPARLYMDVTHKDPVLLGRFELVPDWASNPKKDAADQFSRALKSPPINGPRRRRSKTSTSLKLREVECPGRITLTRNCFLLKKQGCDAKSLCGDYLLIDLRLREADCPISKLARFLRFYTFLVLVS